MSNVEGLKYLAISFTVLGMIGVAFAISKLFVAAFESISRNPGASAKIDKYVYAAAGLTEAMGLFAFVLGILLYAKL